MNTSVKVMHLQLPFTVFDMVSFLGCTFEVQHSYLMLHEGKPVLFSDGNMAVYLAAGDRVRVIGFRCFDDEFEIELFCNDDIYHFSSEDFFSTFYCMRSSFNPLDLHYLNQYVPSGNDASGFSSI